MGWHFFKCLVSCCLSAVISMLQERKKYATPTPPHFRLGFLAALPLVCCALPCCPVSYALVCMPPVFFSHVCPVSFLAFLFWSPPPPTFGLCRNETANQREATGGRGVRKWEGHPQPPVDQQTREGSGCSSSPPGQEGWQKVDMLKWEKKDNGEAQARSSLF